MIIWLDFKQSHRESFTHAYLKENNKTMTVDSTAHYWSCRPRSYHKDESPKTTWDNSAQFDTNWHHGTLYILKCVLQILAIWQWQSGNSNSYDVPQFGSIWKIWHPVHWWTQNGLVWHIIESAYLNPITYAQNCVLLHHLGRFSIIWHFDKSSWGEYITKLQNATQKWNKKSKPTLFVWKFFKFCKFPGLSTYSVSYTCRKW